MSDPHQELSKGSRSAETKQFWIWVSLVTLFLSSSVNIYLLLFVVPKFEWIFAEALPGMPLPPVTVFIIAARIGLAVIALGWPIIGSVLVNQQKTYAILWINIGLIWTFLEIGTVVIALFMPMSHHDVV